METLIELKFTEEQLKYLQYLLKKEQRHIVNGTSDNYMSFLPNSQKIIQELDLMLRKP